MMVPGVIAMAVKIWVVFVKKYAEKKTMEREMKTGDLEDFYQYQQIENGSINWSLFHRFQPSTTTGWFQFCIEYYSSCKSDKLECSNINNLNIN